MAEGWFADPTGRFGGRFFDGVDWTDRVVGANGAEFLDVLPPDAAPPAPDAGPPSTEPPPVELPAGRTDGLDGPGGPPEIPGSDAGDGADGDPADGADGDAPPPPIPPAPRAPAAAVAVMPPGVARPVRYERGAAVTVELPVTGPDDPDSAAAAARTARLPPLTPLPLPGDGPGRAHPPGPPGPPPPRRPAPARPPVGPPHAAGRPGSAAPVVVTGSAGLAVAALGVVFVLLSLLLLDWSAGTTFLDLAGDVRRAGSAAVGNAIAYAYPLWLAWLLLVLTLVAVGLSARPVPNWRSGSAYPRIGGTVVAAVAALLQTITVTHLFRGPPSPDFGAWLGVAGYLVVIAGLVLGTGRRA